MVKFFFHVKRDGELVTDDDGLDLPSMSEASRAALATARELLADAVKFGKANVPEAIILEDEAGRLQFATGSWLRLRQRLKR